MLDLPEQPILNGFLVLILILFYHFWSSLVLVASKENTNLAIV
jgi:hypothetical protein